MFFSMALFYFVLLIISLGTFLPIFKFAHADFCVLTVHWRVKRAVARMPAKTSLYVYLNSAYAALFYSTHECMDRSEAHFP